MYMSSCSLALRYTTSNEVPTYSYYKYNRVKFVESMVNNEERQHTYDDMFDTVHVDEKWFYVVKDGQGVYILPGEDASRPARAQHKSHIIKVMFLCAVARPRVGHRSRRFDGKIGLWPMIETVQAANNSKNRAAGTDIIKPLNVTAEVYEEYMIKHVLPAIKEKMLPFVDASVNLTQRADQAHPSSSGGAGHAVNDEHAASAVTRFQCV